jgi:hypothetical protein
MLSFIRLGNSWRRRVWLSARRNALKW